VKRGAETNKKIEAALPADTQINGRDGLCAEFHPDGQLARFGNDVDGEPQLIAGPDANICNECVDLCVEVLADSR